MNNHNYEMTSHAHIRLQQRGIKPEIVNLVLNEADKFLPCKGGATSVFVSRKKIKSLENKRVYSPQLIAKALGIVLVQSDDAVITAFHKKRRLRTN
jgi:hypothetical protein